MRVLLVQDNLAEGQRLQSCFTNQSYIADLASTGAEALRLCDTYDHDVIVLGRKLPDRDTFGELRVRINTERLAVEALAGYDADVVGGDAPHFQTMNSGGRLARCVKETSDNFAHVMHSIS